MRRICFCWSIFTPAVPGNIREFPAELHCVGAGETPPPDGVLLLHGRTAKMKVGEVPEILCHELSLLVQVFVTV